MLWITTTMPYGLDGSSRCINKLQFVQNTTARLLIRICIYWLPVKFDINYKLLLLMSYKALTGLTAIPK